METSLSSGPKICERIYKTMRCGRDNRSELVVYWRADPILSRKSPIDREASDVLPGNIVTGIKEMKYLGGTAGTDGVLNPTGANPVMLRSIVAVDVPGLVGYGTCMQNDLLHMVCDIRN